MTHKYERQCWYCGSKHMERLPNYAQCRDCGATWNVVPKLRPVPLTLRRDLSLRDWEQDYAVTASPSCYIAAAATKKRKQKKS